jgi:hypothetical protein
MDLITGPDALNKKEEIQAKLTRVFERALSLIHNLVISDKTSILQRSIHWCFEIYKQGAVLDLPTEELIQGLLASHSKEVYDLRKLLIRLDRIPLQCVPNNVTDLTILTDRRVDSETAKFQHLKLFSSKVLWGFLYFETA